MKNEKNYLSLLNRGALIMFRKTRFQTLHIDLKEPPKKTRFENTGQSEDEKAYGIALGDLHANTMKLINQLVQLGILELSAAQYGALNELFQIADSDDSHLTRDQFQKFFDILNGAVWNRNHAIRLIGDIVGDRRGNDLLTLLTLEAMKNHGIDYDILFSNHDYEFIVTLESDDIQKNSGCFHDNSKLKDSLERLQQSIKRHDVDEPHVRKLYEEVYKPHLKLLEYDGDVFYLHAPVTFKQVQNIARKFDVRLDWDMSRAEKIEAAREVNRRFQEHWVIPNKITENCQRVQTPGHVISSGHLAMTTFFENIDIEESEKEQFPIATAIWQRRLDTSFKNPPEYQQVHGHTGGFDVILKDGSPSELLGQHYVRIDSDVGKIAPPERNQHLDTRVEQPIWLGYREGVGPVFQPEAYELYNELQDEVFWKQYTNSRFKNMPDGIREIRDLCRKALNQEQLLRDIKAVADKRLSRSGWGYCCGLFQMGKRDEITQRVYALISNASALNDVIENLVDLFQHRRVSAGDLQGENTALLAEAQVVPAYQ